MLSLSRYFFHFYMYRDFSSRLVFTVFRDSNIFWMDNMKIYSTFHIFIRKSIILIIKTAYLVHMLEVQTAEPLELNYMNFGCLFRVSVGYDLNRNSLETCQK